MEDLRSCFSIKNLGEASHYLGCHITRDRQAGTLKLDQHRYIQTVARRFDIKRTSVIPAATGTKPLSKSEAPQKEAEVEEIHHIPYWKAVGALMWAATMTRPDLSHTAQQLARLNDNPGPAHWKAAMRAMQYLWRTKDLGITYGGGLECDIKLSAWVNADHATCTDTRRSVSGGAVMLRDGAIS